MSVWVVIHLCTCVNEERGGGESAGSESLSLLSYTLRFVRLADLDRHGESVDSESLSLMSYTLRYVSLADLDRLCQFGLSYTLRYVSLCYQCISTHQEQTPQWTSLGFLIGMTSSNLGNCSLRILTFFL
jgi:hypothetical protein